MSTESVEVTETPAPDCRRYFEYTNKKGRKYYYDTEAGKTTYDFPSDGIIFDPATGKVIYTPPGVKAVITKTVTETKVIKKKHETEQPEPAPVPVVTAPTPVTTVVTTVTTTTERVVHSKDEDSSSSSSSSENEFQMRPSDSADGLNVMDPLVNEPIRNTHGAGQFGTSLPRSGTMIPTITGLAPDLKRGSTVAGPSAAPNLGTQVPRVTGGPVEITGLGPKVQPHQKSVPRVLRTFSAQEIMCLAFGLDRLFSRSALQRFLKKYDIEDYARQEFRITKNKKNRIHVVVSFQKKPLKRPLLKDVPDSLKKKAKLIFGKLLEYTQVVTSKESSNALKVIMRTLLEHNELVDEFFFQILKQITDNPSRTSLMKTWELFLIVASVFPVSDKHRMAILAQVAGYTLSEDQRICYAATFLFIRLEGRHYIGKVLDIRHNKKYFATIPQHPIKGRTYFGAQLYEMMWCQKSYRPRLLIPYVLYYMINQLNERNAMKTNGIFRVAGSESITNDILADVNTDITAISRGDVNVLANLLKIWLKELPNPVIPREMLDKFEEMAEQNKHLGFLEQLPQVHRFTLLYVIGFIKDVCKNSDSTKMGKSDLATIFGPCLVNPVRSVSDQERVEHLTQLSISFVSRCIEGCDPSIVYPLDPFYLENVRMSSLQKEEGGAA